jgi:hypothetical protein
MRALGATPPFQRDHGRDTVDPSAQRVSRQRFSALARLRHWSRSAVAMQQSIGFEYAHAKNTVPDLIPFGARGRSCDR